MSAIKNDRKESRNIAVQDKESDSKKSKQLITKHQASQPTLSKKEKDESFQQFDPEKARGRSPKLSRGGSHPLPKARIQKPPARITTKINKAKPQTQVAKPKIQPKQRMTLQNKTGPRGNSIVNNDFPKKFPKKEITAETIQSRLKKKSPWFQSLMSPVDNAGVKIPDPIGTETAVYQHLENVNVRVNENGMAGLRIMCPYINSVVSPGAADGINYQITADDSTETAIIWSGLAGTPDGAVSFRLVPALMKANARSHRIVSAAIVAQTEIATLSDSGEGCAFVTPLGCNIATPLPYSLYQFQYDSTIAPVNIHKPLIARWYPLQGEANPVAPSQAYDVYENVSYQDFINPDDNQFAGEAGVIPWEFGVIFNGLATSSPGVVRFQICINYEFIPLAMSAMVVTSPSPTDEVEENLVNNWVSEAHVTEVISPKAASVAQSASSVSDDHEPSGLGMLFNVIEEVLPMAMKAIPMLL
jgi:hypothetical protein